MHLLNDNKFNKQIFVYLDQGNQKNSNCQMLRFDEYLHTSFIDVSKFCIFQLKNLQIEILVHWLT